MSTGYNKIKNKEGGCGRVEPLYILRKTKK